jgi:hypothetical protein
VLYLVKGGGATSGVHANSGSSANATAAEYDGADVGQRPTGMGKQA